MTAAATEIGKRLREIANSVESAAAPDEWRDTLLSAAAEIERLSRVAAAGQSFHSAMRMITNAFADTVKGAEENALAKTLGGQQVGCFGDFVHMPPSARGQLRWWARALREPFDHPDTAALTPPPPPASEEPGR